MDDQHSAAAVSVARPANRSATSAEARRDGEHEMVDGWPRSGYRKGVQTRERMITAAQGAIYELGFNRASSREIARRAGMTVGMIRHHFGSFEALLLAAGERGVGEMRAVLASAGVTGETSEEKLAFIAELVWDYFSRPEFISYLEILTNLIRDPATSEQTLMRLKACTKEVENSWLNLMQRTFDTDHDYLVLRQLLFGTMEGLAVMRWMSRERPSFAEERRLFVASIAAYLDSADQNAELPRVSGPGISG